MHRTVLGSKLQILVRNDVIELPGPNLNGGDYEFEWAISDLNGIYNRLEPGEILESNYVVKVDDTRGLLDEENAITQNISIDIQANSLPELVDSGGLPTDGIQPAPDLIRVGGEDEYLILTPEDFGMEFYLDADNDVFSNIQVSSLSDDVSLGYIHSMLSKVFSIHYRMVISFLLITMRNL